jgi:hypothetical protein
MNETDMKHAHALLIALLLARLLALHAADARVKKQS